MASGGEKDLGPEVKEGHWEISGEVVNQALGLTFFLYAAGFFLFLGIVKILDPKVSLLDGWSGTPLGVALSLPALVLHEPLHGLGYWWAKAKPKYGFTTVGGTPAFYTTSPGYWLTRSQYVVVTILPMVGVSAIGLLLMAFVPQMRYGLITALTIHLMACAGDILFVWKLLHLPKEARFHDNMTGFDYRL